MKRFLTLTLCLILLLGALPLTASAKGGIQVYTDQFDPYVYSGGTYDISVSAVGGSGTLHYDWQVRLPHERHDARWSSVGALELNYIYRPYDSAHLRMTTDWLNGYDKGDDWDLLRWRCHVYDDYGNDGYSPEYSMLVYSPDALRNRIEQEALFTFAEVMPYAQNVVAAPGNAVDFYVCLGELTEWMQQSELTVKQYFILEENGETRRIDDVHYAYVRYGQAYATMTAHAELYCGETLVAETERTWNVAVAKPAPRYRITVRGGTADKAYAIPGEIVTIETENIYQMLSRFANWTVEEGAVELANPKDHVTSFVMPAEDVTVSASLRFQRPHRPPTETSEPVDMIQFFVTEPVDGERRTEPKSAALDVYHFKDYFWEDIETGRKLGYYDTFREGRAYRLCLSYELASGYKETADALHIFNDADAEACTWYTYETQSDPIGGDVTVEVAHSGWSRTYVCAAQPTNADKGMPPEDYAVEGIDVYPVNIELGAGQSEMFFAVPRPYGVKHNGLSYSVEDSSVVQLGDGYLTVLPDARPGKVTRIAVTCEGVTEYCTIRVAQPPEQAETPDGRPNPFTDIWEQDYFYNPVLWAYYHEPQITNGVSETRFDPWGSVTRGQAVTFLWRAMGCPEPAGETNPFVDIQPGEYWYKAVLWAVQRGITNGVDETHFAPDDTLSTAHIVTFLYRALGVGADGWYEEARDWAENAGLLLGTAYFISPDDVCPRAMMLTLLYRALK